MAENQPSGAPGQLPIDIKNVDEHGQSRISNSEALRNALVKAEAPPDVKKGDESAPAAKPVGDKPAAAPAPKMLTETEVEQRIKTIQGGHEGTVKKMRADIAALQAQIAEAHTKAEEASIASYLRAVEEKGGDVDAAKQTVELNRQAKSLLAKAAAKEAELAEKEAKLNDAGKGKYANDLVAQYGLTAADLPKLLEATDDVDMERRALKLHVEALNIKAKPPEHPDPALNRAKGVDVSKLPINTRMGMAMEGQI
jgi:hypothetical protein